jgi:molecular chaperone DnaJ
VPDYYAILGVARDAAPEEIKKAYRRLARGSHPDANPSDPHAEERFKQISEAYAVLSDPAARQRFDTYGDADPRTATAGFGDLGNIFDAFFGGGFGGGRARTRTSAVPGQDVGVSVTLSLGEAVTGTKVPVHLDTVAACDRCEGDGCEPGTFRARCGTCAGQGEIRSSRQTILGTVMTSRPCTTCEGAGEAPAVPCATCRGGGRVRASREVTVDIPAGIADGMTLRLRAQGEAGVRGGASGDLFVRVHVTPHEVFEREGDDLVCDLAVPLTQAVLGAQVPVRTLDAEQLLRIEPGTQHGTVLRIRGHGVTRLDGRGRGDLLVHISIDIPTKLSQDERALFERLAQVRGEPTGVEQRGMLRRLRDSLRG